MNTIQNNINETVSNKSVDESYKRGLEIGKEIGRMSGMSMAEVKHTLMIYRKGYSHLQISDLLNLPIERVLYILNDHGFYESAR